MKQILLFDIDLCLINTNIVRKNIKESLTEIMQINKKGLEYEHINYYKTLKTSKDFKPENYCRFLAAHFNVDYNELIKVFYYHEEIYKKALYKDTLLALKKLQTKYTLGIYSEGFKKFQLAKLKYSGILPYFNKKYIFIKRRKLSNTSLGLIPKNSVIIDDNENVITQLKTRGFRTVWVKRNSASALKDVYTIHNLNELLKI